MRGAQRGLGAVHTERPVSSKARRSAMPVAAPDKNASAGGLTATLEEVHKGSVEKCLGSAVMLLPAHLPLSLCRHRGRRQRLEQLSLQASHFCRAACALLQGLHWGDALDTLSADTTAGLPVRLDIKGQGPAGHADEAQL